MIRRMIAREREVFIRDFLTSKTGISGEASTSRLNGSFSGSAKSDEDVSSSAKDEEAKKTTLMLIIDIHINKCIVFFIIL